MTRSLYRVSLLCLAVFAVASPCPAFAQDRDGDEDARQANPHAQARKQARKQDRKQDRHALSAAVRRVTRTTQGQVLSAERVQFDGRDVNRIKIVDDRGRVRVYWDDPQAQQRSRRAEPPRQAPQRARTRRDDSDDPTL